MKVGYASLEPCSVFSDVVIYSLEQQMLRIASPQEMMFIVDGSKHPQASASRLRKEGAKYTTSRNINRRALSAECTYVDPRFTIPVAGKKLVC
jgi:hypothetical protein